MNLELFIARRLYKEEKGNRRVSRPAVLIAQVGVALGLAVMLVTVGISLGFKHEIRSKAIGFGSHIHISNFNASQSYEAAPVAAGDSFLTVLRSQEGIRHVQRYATKPGIFRTDEAFQGFVLKGIGEEYDLSFFQSYLVEGELPTANDSLSSNKVLVSRIMAEKLRMKVGDRMDTYFIQNAIRARRLTVTGIYETGFSDYDKLFALTDLKTVQTLNRWEEDQVTGIEVELDDYNQLAEKAQLLSALYDRTEDEYGELYYVQTVEELNPNLFAWLNILDINVWVILFLMLGVAGFTMISGLLILILERTNFIGILKALGSPNVSIRRTFLYLAAFIIGKGMLWGNVVGLLLCAVQRTTGLIPLDPQNYYLNVVPIEFNWALILLLNVGMLLLSLLMLVLPSQLISHIYPSKTVQFE